MKESRMSVEREVRAVHVSAGDGIVAHVKNLTAHATGDETRLNELLVQLNALANAPWQEIVRTLTAGIVEAGYDHHPHLACVSVDEDRVAALVFGDTALSITIDGAETILDGRDSSTWIDVALRGKVDRVHAGIQSESTVVGVLRDGVVPAGGFLLDTGGPMPASGRWAAIANSAQDASATVEAEPEAVEPEAIEPEAIESDGEFESSPVELAAVKLKIFDHELGSAEDEDRPIPAPAARGMFARIDEFGREDNALTIEELKSPSVPRLFGSESAFQTNGDSLPNETRTGPAEVSDDGATVTESSALKSAPTLALERPQLRGVLCLNEHLTAPNESSCRTCGEPIASDAQQATGNRPTMGTLTFDDGAILTIDRPAVIGANVPTGYVVGDEPATIVRLDDGVGGVSDVQVEVRLSGWNVEIVDMQSKNGTYTMLRGERQTRTKLRASQSVTLQPGMTIESGGRHFTFS
ncbi:MAG: hypothetical protein ACI81L_003391 [Verrucomicrobiales bacterium]|jgi:hypothetical protein